MTTLADIINGVNKPYERPDVCPNCKGKGQVRVFVRANEVRLISCPTCGGDEPLPEDSHQEDVGC